tara:strand:- start:139 stop:1200 length:1062 start_codon:yes stop_codon:yes gene_type:complete
MRILRLITINVLLLFIFLLVADFSTAFIRRRNNLERVSARQINAFFHHGFIPNAVFKHNWESEITLREKVNKFGFRANISEKSVDKITDYKTVFIGDSFAEGVGVEYKKTIPSLLSVNLWPIANLGVMSHSPYLSRNRLDFFKEKGLNPEVIIHLVDPSDIQDELHYYFVEGFRPPKNTIARKLAALINDSYISSTFTWEAFLTISWLLNSESILRSIDLYKYWNGSKNYYETRNPFKTNEEPFFYKRGKNRLLNELELSISNNNKSEYIVVIYQWPQFINPLDKSNKTFRLQEYKNDMKELTNRFDNAYLCDADNANLNDSDFIKGDVHWNKSGHLKIANFISSECIQKIIK